MTDQDRQDAMAALLSDEAVWAEPPPGVEDAVVAAVGAESGQVAAHPPTDAIRDHTDEQVDDHLGHQAVQPPARGRRRATLTGAGVGLAAAALVLLVAIALDVVDVTAPQDGPPVTAEVALVGTGEAADARGDAVVHELANGARIVLDVTGLPPAPPGRWYEMSLLRPDAPSVSAGSFHMRGGDGSVALWSGVGVHADQTVQVTLEPEGTVVLTGQPSD